jgi:hypothetical protein
VARSVNVCCRNDDYVADAIKEAEVSYVVTTQLRSFLAAYFDAHSQFDRVHVTKSLGIYQPTSNDLEPIAFTPRIDRSTEEYLENVE